MAKPIIQVSFPGTLSSQQYERVGEFLRKTFPEDQYQIILLDGGGNISYKPDVSELMLEELKAIRRMLEPSRLTGPR